jgi:4-amino-4-deoxy-L-arabinose transferase-like glycosyltransferase
MRPDFLLRARRHAEPLALAAVVLLFIGLGVWYSLAVPPFEKPDEVYHYAFARHLSQGNPLPVQTTESDGPWLHEGTQAPLYYFLVGRLTAGIDQSDFEQLIVPNPQVNLGVPLLPGNKNLMLYSGRRLPLRGTNLAVHVGRWFSLALGCITILLVYLTARLAFARRSPLPVLSALLAAAIPQVAFIHSSVSNDSLIAVTSVAVIYWLARLLTRNRERSIRGWEWAVLGLLLGLAALSKLQGLVLLAPAGLVIFWLAWQRRSPRLLLAAALLVVLPALAVAGWWYWRNYTLYGEWLAANQLLTITGLRTTPRTWRGFVGEMNGLRYSFWALFGWFNIMLPAWAYHVLDAVTGLAFAGLLLRGLGAWRGRRNATPDVRVKLFLALWAFILVTFMVYWSTFATSSQGRLLFPFLSAFSVLMVAGLSFWTDFLARPWRLPALAVLPAGLLACSLASLVVILPAAYHAPAPLRELPASAQEVDLAFTGADGAVVELVGVDLPVARFRPGQAVPVTLYLRAPHKLTTDLFLFVQLLDDQGIALGNITTHTGWGRNPTSLWEPGVIYADAYRVPVAAPVDNRSPLAATVYVGFTLPDNATSRLEAHTADGTPVTGKLGQVDILPAQPLDASGLTPLAVTFDDGIRLIGARFPVETAATTHKLPLALLWEAAAMPGQDYTMFVHLFDSAGTRVAGFDQPPAEDRYPTSRWQSGDQVLSEFALPLPPDLPAGTYQLWTGLYPSESEGEVRLAVVQSDRKVYDQAVSLGTMTLR